MFYRFSKYLIIFIFVTALYADENYDAGISELENSNHDKAIKFLELSAHAKNLDAYRVLGDIHYFESFPGTSIEEAEKWYRNLARSGSNYGAFMLALVWYENPSFERDNIEILRQFEQAADLGSPDAEFMLGLIFKEGNIAPKDLVRARNLFEKVVRDSPDLYSKYLLAEIYFELGEYSASNDLLLGIIKNEHDLYSDPLFLADIHILSGRNYVSLVDLEAAEENFLQAKKLLEPIEEGSWQLATTLNYLSLNYLTKGQLTLAEKFSLKAIKQRPDDGVAYNNFGIILSERGENGMAKNYFSKSLELLEAEFGAEHMELTPTLNSLGLASSELEEFAEAEEYYTKFLVM